MDAPQIFGKYELLERMAIGGMAEIFLARSSSIGGVIRQCIIKRILPAFGEDPRFVSMFIDEARITIGLDHPNIVRLFDFGQVDQTYYMAMEFVNGLDLVDLLRQKNRQKSTIPIEPALFIVKSICEGLHHAHTQKDFQGKEQGIVHRDVSPHNVFLSWSGEIKVGDFGIASARNKLSHTQTGTVKGKFAYMAPENASRGIVDRRADLWAAGVVLHEMLSGRRLFASDNPIATLARVCEHPISPPSLRNKNVSPQIDALVMHALERDLDKRFQSADLMAKALGDVLGNFDENDFAQYLESETFEDETRASHANLKVKAPLKPRQEYSDNKIRELHTQLRERPDLWLVVEIGKRYVELKKSAKALQAFRAASALFAFRGLLVQSICALAPGAPLCTAKEYERDVAALHEIYQGDPAKLRRTLEKHDALFFLELIRSLEKDGLASDEIIEETLYKTPAPLLGRMPKKDFVRLVKSARVRDFHEGDIIINEGEVSSELFAVGRGRLVVHTQPKAKGSNLFPKDEPSVRSAFRNRGDDLRIYLSALSEGDYFGEFSFLTSKPRSASVEAISPCTVLEIDRKISERILMRDSAYKEPLLEFYKERVGELMLAKNPVFAVLSPEMRRRLLSDATLSLFRDNHLIVKEGDVSGDIYFIKHGEVEIFHEVSGLPVFINKLREGDFFGESAAIEKTPRTANVPTMGDVEVFCIKDTDLEKVLQHEEDARRLFATAIEVRSTERSERLSESLRIFEGT